MKFSMFIHPPRPTPRSTIARPDRVVNPRPDVWRRMASFIESLRDESSARPMSGRSLIGTLAGRVPRDSRWAQEMALSRIDSGNFEERVVAEQPLPPRREDYRLSADGPSSVVGAAS